MFDFFRYFRIEPTSFWIGFSSASLFWWLIVRYRSGIGKLLQRIVNKLIIIRQRFKRKEIQHHLAHTLQYAQNMHLANQLFALDDILIAPRLLTPSVPATSDKFPGGEDVVSNSIPYMPDWPELGTFYEADTLSIAQALAGDSNLVIIGQPGCGKSVTLAALASMAARRELEEPGLKNRVPVLIHALDLILPAEDIQSNKSISSMGVIAESVGLHSAYLSQSRSPEFFFSIFNSGNALFIVDGLDELFQEDLMTVVNFVEQVLQEFPDTISVVAAAPESLGRLPKLGFVPLSVALWSHLQQSQFASNWGIKWSKLVNDDLLVNNNYIPFDPLLLNAWVLNQEIVISPLRFTTQIWSAYLGDFIGNSLVDGLHALILRMRINLRDDMDAICQVAMRFVLQKESTFTFEKVKQWVSELSLEYSEDNKNEEIHSPKNISSKTFLQRLKESGILIPRSNGHFSFLHPEIVGYLAGQAFTSIEISRLIEQSISAIKISTLAHLLHRNDIFDRTKFHHKLQQNHTALIIGEHSYGRWHHDLPLENPWRKNLLRDLVNYLQDNTHSLAYRFRALSALILSNDPNLFDIFQKLSNSEHSDIRKFAALGLGTLSTDQATSCLINLLQDIPAVSDSACLALVRIGSNSSLQAVSDALVHGSENLQKSAAESLANHSNIGYLKLQEMAGFDDLLVQRAVIHGLRRIRQDWALALLDKMQIEEGQWVIKNAAAIAFKEMQQRDPRIPQNLPSLSDTPWLISFAAERDIGISPEKPADKLLLLVLNEGTPREKLAAMMQIRRLCSVIFFPDLKKLLYSDTSKLSHAAYETLWILIASGIEMPQD